MVSQPSPSLPPCMKIMKIPTNLDRPVTKEEVAVAAMVLARLLGQVIVGQALQLQQLK